MWCRRVGPEAAGHRVNNYRCLNRGWVALVIGFLLVLSGGIGHQQIVFFVGWIGFIIWGIFYVLSWRELALWRRALISALGPIKDFPRVPPRSPEKYLAWCRKNGLQPYPFDQTEILGRD